MRYEVTHYPPRQDTAEPTVTDAAGVTDLVRQAALTGTRVYVRPIFDAAEEASEPRTS
jgi:hypothetical protein